MKNSGLIWIPMFKIIISQIFFLLLYIIFIIIHFTVHSKEAKKYPALKNTIPLETFQRLSSQKG